MNNLKRAFLYIIRKKVETVIFALVFVFIISLIYGLFKINNLAVQGFDLLDSDFYESKQSVKSLIEFTNMGTAGIIFIALIILTIIFIFRVNNRFNEIGIYLSLGKTKINIILQQIYELIAIAIFSFPIALLLGSYFSKVLGKKLLLDAVNIGFKDMPLDLSQEIINKKINLLKNIELLDSNINFIIVAKTILILISCIFIAMAVGNYKFYKLTPKKILNKLN